MSERSQTISSHASSWATNTTVEQVAATMRKARSVVVTTHAKPDGDAIGSALAVARSLRHGGADVAVWLTGPLPRWTREMCDRTPEREFQPGRPLTPADGQVWENPDPDLAVVVDTGSWNQVAELRPWLEGRAERTIIMDHHLHGDAPMASRRIVDSTSASCTQVVAPVCAALMGASSAAGLPADVAEPLYLGLATDTGWFRYSSVTPATLRLAADLVEAGVNHTRLYRVIEQQDNAARWRLLGRALSSLVLHDIGGAGRIATMRLTLGDFRQTGADQNDMSGFADMVLTVASVEVSVVLSESPVAPGEPPLTKFSLRSKPGPGAVDVNAVAKKLGGGGHARAAGAKMRAGLDDAQRALLEALR